MRKLRRFQKQHHLDKYLVSSLHPTRFPKLKKFKYLPKVMNASERRQAVTLATLSILSLLVIIGHSFLWVTDAIPEQGGEYTEALIGSPRFINPILAQTSDVDLDLSRLVFSGLMRYEETGTLIPDLAQTHEISADGLTYTFVIREGVLWHDGEKLSVDDIIFTIASIQDPEFKSPLSRSFRGVAAEKIDDRTVKFTLKEPFAPFLGLLTVGILPEHLWYNIPAATADLAELNKKPVGTGQWQFENSKKDSNGIVRSYTFTKNPNYYGTKPYINTVTFKFYGDTISAVEAFKSKNVKGLAYVPQELRGELKKYKNIGYKLLEQPQYNAIFFNQSKNELLKADYIRQALALAIDKQRFIDGALGGQAQPIDYPTLPTVTAPENITTYSHNPQAAVELLEKNGWNFVSTTTEDGLTEQVREKNKIRLEVTLTVVEQEHLIAIANSIKSAWDQIGVHTTIITVDRSKILTDVINNRSYEALLFGQNMGSDPDPFAFWHSSQNSYPGLGLSIGTNRRVDEIIEGARINTDPTKRQEQYQELLSIISKELPAIFLYNPYYVYVQDRDIKGNTLEHLSVPADRLSNMSQWYINTRRIWRQ
jgi:peptide/nickel transport system substrate-binding protein